jgi:hypothetical protein
MCSPFYSRRRSTNSPTVLAGDASRRFALDFKLGRQLHGEVFVEQLLAAIDFDTK